MVRVLYRATCPALPMAFTAMTQNSARVRVLLGRKVPAVSPATTPSIRRLSTRALSSGSLTSEKDGVAARAGVSSPAASTAASSTEISRFMSSFSLLSYSARSASTGCRPEALMAGYMPKMTPSTTENRKAPMVMACPGIMTMSSSILPAMRVPR